MAAGTIRGTERPIIRLSHKRAMELINDNFEDWDDEELKRGRRRDANGRFSGTRPTVVPLGVLREAHKRTLAEAERKLREGLPDAIEKLMELVRGKDVDEGVQLKAIALVLDRVVGKEPISVSVNGGAAPEAPWQGLMANSIVAVGEIGAGDPDDVEGVQEAEVVEPADGPAEATRKHAERIRSAKAREAEAKGAKVPPVRKRAVKRKVSK